MQLSTNTQKGYDTTISRMTENKQTSELGRLVYNCQSATFTNCIGSVCFFVSVAKKFFLINLFILHSSQSFAKMFIMAMVHHKIGDIL